jgi:hypothetical protein
MNADNQSPERFPSPSPTLSRRRRPSRALLAGAALALLGATTLISCSGCSVHELRAVAVREPFPATDDAAIVKLHDPEALRADLDHFHALQLEATPDIQKHTRLDHASATLERLKASIDRPLDRRSFSAIVDQLAASYGAGHIYALTPAADWNAWAAGGGRVPSYRFIDDGNTLSIQARDGVAPLPEGATLVSFAGIGADELRARMRASVSAETEAYLQQNIPSTAPVVLWGLGLEAPYYIVLRNATGAIVEIKDAGIPAQRKRRTFERISADDEAGDQGSAAAEPAADPWSFRWVGDASGEDIGLLTWDSMSLGTEVAWAKELDRVFTELESRKARGLIVDIRANGGGNSENGALLLESVSDNPYRGASGKLWKRSRPYDAFVEACLVWWARILPWRSFMGIGDLDLGEQRWFAKDVPPSNDPDIKRRFNGPVALLVGPGTFSSANMTADMAKSYRMALLVGRPTGEPVNSIGECGFAQLPNSGLIVSFCTAYFLGAAGDPESGGPVEPDILVPDDDGGARAIEVAIQALRERNATPR